MTAVLCSLPFAVNADMAQNKAEAKKITSEFFAELKGELVKGMKAGGPVAATSVCNAIAPVIADKHSKNSGWEVGRTSLKVRHPDNAPDDWETMVLNRFEELRANGEAPDALVYTEVTEENGEQYFRFMKGIVMPPLEKMPCLKCHGDNIDAKVAAQLDELYPKDQARGYTAGQVRGAFTLKKKL